MNIQLKQIFAEYMIKKVCKNVDRSLSSLKQYLTFQNDLMTKNMNII